MECGEYCMLPLPGSSAGLTTVCRKCDAVGGNIVGYLSVGVHLVSIGSRAESPGTCTQGDERGEWSKRG